MASRLLSLPEMSSVLITRTFWTFLYDTSSPVMGQVCREGPLFQQVQVLSR